MIARLIVRTGFLLLLCFGLGCSSPADPIQQPDPENPAAGDVQILSGGEVDAAPITGTTTLEVKVYYRHPLLVSVVAIPRQIFHTDREVNLIKQVIDHLTIGPDPSLGSALWPANTHVREVYTLSDGTLVVDFNGSFVEGIHANVLEEDFMVYSLVQSLLENFPKYKKVRILIDGEVQETFLGHVDIEFPLGLRKNPLTIVPDPVEEIIVEDLDGLSNK